MWKTNIVPNLISVALCLFFTACHKSATPPEIQGDCGIFQSQVSWSQRINVLNLLSVAFMKGCDQEVIEYGAKIQEDFREKTYSFSRESVSIFLSDGVLTDYVLESYERAYLNLLRAASFLRMGLVEEAKVELRKLDHELFVPLYNFGEDPVNLILSAVLWEVLKEPVEARVDWFRLAEPGQSTVLKVDPALQVFAQSQVRRLDSGKPPPMSWRIQGVGRFPRVDWELKLFGAQNGYFSITPQPSFPTTCVSETGIRVSTESWFKKIARRHDQAYHPLLNIQSWLRLPVGVVYGLVPFSLGAGVAVGGCAGAASLGGSGSGDLCGLSLLSGIELMSVAPTVFTNTVRPDLRHWELLPAAFIVTQVSNVEEETCYLQKSHMHALVSGQIYETPLPSD